MSIGVTLADIGENVPLVLVRGTRLRNKWGLGVVLLGGVAQLVRASDS